MPGGHVNRTTLSSNYQNVGDVYSDTKTEGAMEVIAQQIDDNYDAAVAINNGLSGHKSAAVLDHPDASVTTNKLADKSVTTPKIADGAVGINQLSPGAQVNESVNNMLITALKADNTQRSINIMYPPAPLMAAKGDGTDESAIFAATFAYLVSTGGGKIFVPEGIFYAVLKIPAHCGIEGTGEKSIIKTPNNSIFHGVQLYNDTTKFVTIKNITIDGNKANQASDIDGIHFYGSTAYSPDSDYYSLTDAYFTVKDTYVINCKGYGIYDNARGASIIDSVNVLNSNLDGVYILSFDNIITNTNSGQNKGNGFSVLSDNNRLHNIKSWNNGLGNTGLTAGYGIYMYGANHCSVQGECQGNLLDGVYVKQSELNIIDVIVDVSGKRDDIVTSGVNAYKLENALRNTIRGTVNNRPDRDEQSILYAVGLYGSSIANHVRLTGHYMATGNVYVDAGATFATTNDIVFYGTSGKSEVASLTVTAAATSTGNVTVTLNGVGQTVAVTSGDTISQVASKIRATSFSGWTTGGTGATVTFIAATVGNKTDATYSAGTTGATGTMTTTTQGVASATIDYSQVPAIATLTTTVNGKLNKLTNDLTAITTWGGVMALMTLGDVIITTPALMNNALLPKTGLNYGTSTITMGTGGRISCIITSFLSSTLMMYVGSYNNGTSTMVWQQATLGAVV